jgi:hypothetical protein
MPDASCAADAERQPDPPPAPVLRALEALEGQCPKAVAWLRALLLYGERATGK